jgi:DNA-binding NarL/FixJ family response regulator
VKREKQENLIRLVLLDAHALFRVSLSRLLASEPGFAVVSECAHAAEALKILRESPVDLVLLDLDLGTERADKFMSTARRAGYQGRFLIVTGETDARAAATALKLGASGIFLKSGAPEQLEGAIELIMKGGVWLDPIVIQLLNKELADRKAEVRAVAMEGTLTERQNEVLRGISRGLTNKRIGENLGLSEGSIKSVVQQLFYKAGVRTRSQLVRAAIEGSLGTVGNLTKQ